MNFEELRKIIHDIKQPVANIKVSASTIESALGEKEIDKDAILGFCAIIQRSCNSINLLASNFQDIMNCRSNMIPLNYTSCNLSDYANMYYLSIKPYVESCNVSFSINVLCDNVVFSCDYDKLTRVLNNLVTNAIKYNKSPEKSVVVDFDICDNQLVLTVSDNGIGIPKADIDKVVLCNYRAKNGITVAQGCGLGMAIVKEFVDIMDGKLNIKSKVNTGTKITVTIPEGVVTALNSNLQIKELESYITEMEFSTLME